MHAAHAIRSLAPTRSRHLPLISSRRAGSIATMASTSARAESFITPALLTDGAADRWRKYLSSVSRAAATSGCDTIPLVSSAARSWRGRALGWASAATAF